MAEKQLPIFSPVDSRCDQEQYYSSPPRTIFPSPLPALGSDRWEKERCYDLTPATAERCLLPCGFLSLWLGANFAFGPND